MLGNARYSYDEFSRLLASLGVAFVITTHSKTLDNGEPTAELVLQCNGLDENFPHALELFRLQLDSIIFTEHARMRQCLRSAASNAAASIVTRNGLARCNLRCSVGLDPNGALAEANGGFAGYERMQHLANCTDSELDALAEQMRACATWLRQIPLVSFGFLGTDKNFECASNFVQQFAYQQDLGVFKSSYELPKPLTPSVRRHEYLPVETQVACCSRVISAQALSEREGIALNVLGRILSVGYLWDAIRVKCGAYMVRASYARESGLVSFNSGDDPQPGNSFAVFDSVIEQLRSGALLDAHATDEAIIACFGHYLRPIYPVGLSAACASSIAHHSGNERRQERYEILASLTAADLHNIGERIFDPTQNSFNDCAIVPKGTQLTGFERIMLS